MVKKREKEGKKKKMMKVRHQKGVDRERISIHGNWKSLKEPLLDVIIPISSSEVRIEITHVYGMKINFYG